MSKQRDDEFLKIGNNDYYYVDFEQAYNAIRPTFHVQGENGESKEPEEGSIDVFKMEILKLALERVIMSTGEGDEPIMGLDKANLDIGFKLAFNTLLKYNIIKEAYE